MPKKLPIISITTEPKSDSSEEDDDSNDMNYDTHKGTHTDVEDFDSRPSSRRSSISRTNKPTKSPYDNEVTDVEDYNDSDSEEEEKSRVYPELKMSLTEFLHYDAEEVASQQKDGNEKTQKKAGNFLQSQNLNGNSDYLTDCEDYNTDDDSDWDDDCKKSVCGDLINVEEEAGRMTIADEVHSEIDDDDDDDDDDNISVMSDISHVSDLACGFASNVMAELCRGFSQDEVLEQIDYSASSYSSDDEVQHGANISVAFIDADGKHRSSPAKRPTINSKNLLGVSSCQREDVLTDVEGMDDSAAEDDSFDDDEECQQKPIPRAVIIEASNDSNCLTDTEDYCLDDLEEPPMPRVIATIPASALPATQREVIVLKEDKFGDTTTQVMPMESDYQFGMYYKYSDEVATETEDDASCSEDYCERRVSLGAISLTATESNIEGEVTIANEQLKPMQNKRQDLLSTTESVTDVEEFFEAGTTKRKKLKARSMSKGKSKYLEVVKCTAETGTTDVEEMDLSEKDLPNNVSIVEGNRAEPKTTQNTDKVTDVEDMTADDISDVSDVDYMPEPTRRLSLVEFLADSENILVKLDADAKTKTKTSSKHRLPVNIQQNHTDVEDIQMPSEPEDTSNESNDINKYPSSDISQMVQESCTVVLDKSKNNRFHSGDPNRLHIKGVPVTRDVPTDIEYVESDESAAKGGN